MRDAPAEVPPGKTFVVDFPINIKRTSLQYSIKCIPPADEEALPEDEYFTSSSYEGQ